VEPAGNLPVAVLSSQRYTPTLGVAPSVLQMFMGVRYLNIWAVVWFRCCVCNPIFSKYGAWVVGTSRINGHVVVFINSSW